MPNFTLTHTGIVMSTMYPKDFLIVPKNAFYQARDYGYSNPIYPDVEEVEKSILRTLNKFITSDTSNWLQTARPLNKLRTVQKVFDSQGKWIATLPIFTTHSKLPNEAYLQHLNFLDTVSFNCVEDLKVLFSPGDTYLKESKYFYSPWLENELIGSQIYNTFEELPSHIQYCAENPDKAFKIEQIYFANHTKLVKHDRFVKDIKKKDKISNRSRLDYTVYAIPADDTVLDRIIEMKHSQFLKLLKVIHNQKITTIEDWHVVIDTVLNSKTAPVKFDQWGMISKIVGTLHIASNETLSQSTVLSFVNSLKYQNKSPVTFSVLYDYLSQQSKTLTNEKINLLCAKFLPGQFFATPAFQSEAEREEILGALVKKDTSENIVNFILSLDRGFTLNQWLKFVENYDEYKNYPSTWLSDVL